MIEGKRVLFSQNGASGVKESVVMEEAKSGRVTGTDRPEC